MTLEIDWICLDCGEVGMLSVFHNECRRCGWKRPPSKTDKEKGSA